MFCRLRILTTFSWQKLFWNVLPKSFQRSNNSNGTDFLWRVHLKDFPERWILWKKNRFHVTPHNSSMESPWNIDKMKSISFNHSIYFTCNDIRALLCSCAAKRQSPKNIDCGQSVIVSYFDNCAKSSRTQNNFYLKCSLLSIKFLVPYWQSVHE